MPPPPRPSERMPRVVGCSLPPELHQRLTAIAQTKECSISAVMRELLVRGLSQDEPDRG